MANEEAYKALLKLCEEREYWATRCALGEDGYDPNVDYLSMYEEWKNE